MFSCLGKTAQHPLRPPWALSKITAHLCLFGSPKGLIGSCLAWVYRAVVWVMVFYLLLNLVLCLLLHLIFCLSTGSAISLDRNQITSFILHLSSHVAG